MLDFQIAPDVAGRVRVGLLVLEGVSVRESDAALDAITAHLTGAIPARPRPSAPARPPVAIGRDGGAAVQPPTA